LEGGKGDRQDDEEVSPLEVIKAGAMRAIHVWIVPGLIQARRRVQSEDLQEFFFSDKRGITRATFFDSKKG